MLSCFCLQDSQTLGPFGKKEEDLVIVVLSTNTVSGVTSDDEDTTTPESDSTTYEPTTEDSSAVEISTDEFPSVVIQDNCEEASASEVTSPCQCPPSTVITQDLSGTLTGKSTRKRSSVLKK